MKWQRQTKMERKIETKVVSISQIVFLARQTACKEENVCIIWNSFRVAVEAVVVATTHTTCTVVPTTHECNSLAIHLTSLYYICFNFAEWNSNSREKLQAASGPTTRHKAPRQIYANCLWFPLQEILRFWLWFCFDIKSIRLLKMKWNDSDIRRQCIGRNYFTIYICFLLNETKWRERGSQRKRAPQTTQQTTNYYFQNENTVFLLFMLSHLFLAKTDCET